MRTPTLSTFSLQVQQFLLPFRPQLKLVCNLLVIVISTKMHTIHIQCLLRVDGSTLVGVFLTSFCVTPESSYFFKAASSSLLVAWYLNCSSAASSTESTVHAFIQNFCTEGGGYRNWQLFNSIDPYMLWCQTNLDYSYSWLL